MEMIGVLVERYVTREKGKDVGLNKSNNIEEVLRGGGKEFHPQEE